MPKRTRRSLTEEERAERRDAERRRMEAAVEQLRCSEGWQRWLRSRRHFHRYSLHNQMLIALQFPDASRVAGFGAWLKLGYAVRKGESGIWIWAPCPPSKRRLKKWREEGADPEQRPRTFYKMVAVFDRSQVDPLAEFPGGPAPVDPPGEPIEGEGLARLFAPIIDFAATIGYAAAAEKIPGPALGFCDRYAKRIGVEDISATFSGNAQVATLIHEVAHALVLADRAEHDPVLSYGEEEAVVECVAFTVCGAVGLDTSASSVPYVTGWGAGGEIERYAKLIDRLARRLEEAVLPVGPKGEARSHSDEPIAA